MGMDHAMTGNAQVGSYASTLIHVFEGWLERIAGPSLAAPAFGTVTWADVCVAACFGVLTLILRALVGRALRRRAEAKPGAPPVETMRKDSLAALGKPLYLLLWLYGLYLAVTPFVLRLERGEGWRTVGSLLDRSLDVAGFVVLLWLCLRFTHVLEAWLKQWVLKTTSRLDDLLVPLVGKSLRIIVPVLGIIFALPLLDLPERYAEVVGKATSILLIVAVALILWQLVGSAEKAILAGYDINAADNLRARKAYTQVHVISKTLYVAITLFGLASVLMLFKEVQRLGTSILASAGVLGIIFGFAAQKTIANLFAGFQLAITQPIRLDDVVIVEGEWGRIEEITLTYVVVRIWDERRLLVPLSHFIEQPFQNWTRISADLLGSVSVWVDYSLPLDQVRAALQGIIESDPNWDKRFWNLQVTEASERSMQIRVLATSADSSKSWDLRCSIREKLIDYLQRHHPESLPKLRTDLGTPPSPESGQPAMPASAAPLADAGR